MAVPAEDPQWNYQDNVTGRTKRDQMVRCLIASMDKTAQKIANYDKLREVTQEPNENPASFLSRLTEALILHTC